MERESAAARRPRRRTTARLAGLPAVADTSAPRARATCQGCEAFASCRWRTDTNRDMFLAAEHAVTDTAAHLDRGQAHAPSAGVHQHARPRAQQPASLSMGALGCIVEIRGSSSSSIVSAGQPKGSEHCDVDSGRGGRRLVGQCWRQRGQHLCRGNHRGAQAAGRQAKDSAAGAQAQAGGDTGAYGRDDAGAVATGRAGVARVHAKHVEHIPEP